MFSNVAAAHDTICFECLLMRSVLSTRRGIEERRNRHRQNGMAWSVAVVSSEALSAGSRWPFPLPLASRNSILST